MREGDDLFFSHVNNFSAVSVSCQPTDLAAKSDGAPGAALQQGFVALRLLLLPSPCWVVGRAHTAHDELCDVMCDPSLQQLGGPALLHGDRGCVFQ